jgi:hypothetical protein
LQIRGAGFLVEVPHQVDEAAYARIVEILLKTGPHFLLLLI